MRYGVELPRGTVLVSPDDPVPPERRWQVLVSGRAVDQLTGATIEASCSTTTDAMRSVSGPGGMVGLAGRPYLILPGVPWDLTVKANGFLDRVETGSWAGIPDDRATLGLIRRPTEIVGRVQEVSAGTTPNAPRTIVGPLPGVTIEVTGIRRAAPPGQFDPVNLVAVDHPLSAPHAPGTVVERLQVIEVPPAGARLELADNVAAGRRDLPLRDLCGVAAGSILRLGTAGEKGTEFATVVATDSFRSIASLEHPLSVRRASDAPVIECTAVVQPGAALLIEAAVAGESSLVVPPQSVPPGPIRIVGDASAGPEIREAQLYRTTSGTDGSWRLPPIGRVVEVRVQVTPTQHGLRVFPRTTAQPVVRLVVGAPTQRLDVQFERTAP